MVSVSRLYEVNPRLKVEATVYRAGGAVEDLGVVGESPRFTVLAKVVAALVILALALPLSYLVSYWVLALLGATLVVNAGRAVVTNRLVNGSNPPIFVGWGTGAGTTAATDTTLFTEASEARASATATQQTTTTSNDSYRLVATLTAAAGKTITNAGALDASTAGNLFFKTDFTGIALNTGDSIQFTFTVNFT